MRVWFKWIIIIIISALTSVFFLNLSNTYFFNYAKKPEWVNKGTTVSHEGKHTVFLAVGKVSGFEHRNAAYYAAERQALSVLSASFQTYSVKLMKRYVNEFGHSTDTDLIVEDEFPVFARIVRKHSKITDFWQDSSNQQTWALASFSIDTQELFLLIKQELKKRHNMIDEIQDSTQKP